MNRYLLDTNVVIFLITRETDQISRDVWAILNDYANTFETSSITAMELVQLYRIGNLKHKRGQNINDVFKGLESELNIKISPFGEKHIKTLADLEVIEGHNDPFDHAIISHAITDHYTLISSDSKFKYYISQKLDFVYNRR